MSRSQVEGANVFPSNGTNSSTAKESKYAPPVKANPSRPKHKLPSTPAVYVSPEASEILTAQPLSLIGMSQAERDVIIVSAVADEQGNEYEVSRIGDRSWRLLSLNGSGPKNKKLCQLTITWPTDVPKSLVDDAKAVLYCALRRGPHGQPWSASFVCSTAAAARLMLRHLVSVRVETFSDLRAIHLSDYISDAKRRLKANSIRNITYIIELVRQFQYEVLHPLVENPWADQTHRQACGCNDNDPEGPSGRTGKTPVIPRSLQRDLFDYCESRVLGSEPLFQARDAGEIGATAPDLIEVRDSILYLTEITTGMRNSECIDIKNGCCRAEVKNGVTYHWIRTTEFKTGKGIVDFLAPAETLKALSVLQRYAQPLQARLADEAKWLESLLKEGGDENDLLPNGMLVTDAISRLHHVRQIATHIYLGIEKRHSDHLGTGSRVDTLKVQSCNVQLQGLARAVGSDWKLANHQCRRTFGYNVANSRLGRMGLVFLKWQLKHSSMSWTELYASNPYQDSSLYTELEDEQTAARVELMEGWMQSGAPLSGGAGRKLMLTRAIPVRNLQELLSLTAEHLEIRCTGHSWCISGARKCHGQGVYEPSDCADCSQAIIDLEQASTWQMIHLDNLRLAAIVDCGPAVVQKAQRSIARSMEVLSDLRVPLPSEAQAAAYV
ncbi:integrase [Paraburkholderia strydomiana]|uniref:integrase n=1 Tax=Paraburkholderia strydomiana TaxID=1245417 RepID=UPI0038B7FC46